ncbi:acyltransferase family protein [Streptomonospora salina]|uniref:Peptidoglycan/LPS O-acetylase OafA/YrhL n=1 Tax=Streptomonospora salina TaxID=104205 RepID=A0A841E1A9_9ACTN|nr:acyltransferase family protein [Streptomonospora salina]MBB5996915.1 peptidoglycan/LPS O-acetylase OafA/YrhL [Streptomonospora salina]
MSVSSSAAGSAARAASAPAPAPGGPPGGRERRYRPEVQGLRAVAVVLVAVYHIWFDRVSGGVDVFLLLTGFLITGSLVRALERDGAVGFAAFFGRLVRRLVPAAAVVLAAVLAAAPFLLPGSQLQATADQVLASALYVENWHLALNAVDYTAQNSAAGPLQHFWSLSVQGQAYLLWPALVAAAALAANRLGVGLRRAVPVALAPVFAGSLAYSVHITAADQPWAYFDTGARLWELALGGLLALLPPAPGVPGRVRAVLGWVGLSALVLCGALMDVSALFPGYTALWPTTAAALVVLGGGSERWWGADRLLSWRPLTRLGDLAYALYLWHWPVLVFYLQATGREAAGLLGGCLVLAVSVLLAAATTALVRDGLARLQRGPRGRLSSLGAAAAALLLVAAASSAWSARLTQEREERREQAESVTDEGRYPGAQVLADPRLAETTPRAPVLPAPADAKADQNIDFENGCHVGLDEAEPVVCEYGPDSAEHTVALVGASRSAHWFAALWEAAQANGWRVVTLTKSGCQFSTDPPTLDGEPFAECVEWREGAMAELDRRRPDAVLTSSTRALPSDETVHPGFIERWQQLDAMGIDVVGIRDLPRIDYEGAACVEANGRAGCASPESYSHAETDPARSRSDIPANVELIDLTDYVCPDGRCPAVVGNVLVFWDHSHLTATYSRTLAPILGERVRAATGW